MSVKTTPYHFTEDVKLYLSVFFEDDGIDGLNRAVYHLSKKESLKEMVTNEEKRFRLEMERR